MHRTMTYVRRLRWHPGSVAHIKRHAIVPQEVAEVCHGDPVELESYQERLILTGPMQSGRMLAVVLEPEPAGVFYVVTARPASRKERRHYREQKGAPDAAGATPEADQPDS